MLSKYKSENLKGRANFYSLVIIIITTFSVFYSSLHNFILNWDDQWQVCNSFTEGGLSMQNITSFFFYKYRDQYSPLNQLVYIFIYKIDGYNPFFFHLISLIFHILNGCLLFVITKRIISKNVIIKNETGIIIVSLFTSLLFTIHPMQVESVCWISASKVIFFSFFYLISTLLVMKFIDTKRIIYYLAAIFIYILSFLCKEQALTFPIWLILLIYIYDDSVKLSIAKLIKYALPFFILSIAFGLYFEFFISIPVEQINITHYPLWKRIIFLFKSIFLLIKKFLLPINLYYFYPLTNKVDSPLPLVEVLFPFFFSCVLPFIIYKKNKIFIFSILYFITHILLMIHIIPLPRETITADRYIYLALPGLSFLLSYFLYNVYIRFNRYRGLILSVVFLYIVALSFLSFNYTKKWHDPDSLRKISGIQIF